MSVSSFFERLRGKPKETRVQFSLLSALCVTGAVGLLWSTTLPARLARLQTPEDAGLAADAEGLNSFLGDAKSNLAEAIGAGSDGEKSAGAVLPSASGAYVPGAPPQEQPGYYDSPFQEPPPVAPVARKEVRLGTTTSAAPRTGR